MSDLFTPASPSTPDLAPDRLDATAAATTPALDTQQVRATDAALALIERVTAQHGPVMFHQSGGCCDGSAPMCYPDGDLLVGDQDRRLGDIGGMPFYISASQFEYWKGTQLIIDVVPGRGGMFSLEGPLGLRFLTRSRIWTDAEWQALLAAGRVTP